MCISALIITAHVGYGGGSYEVAVRMSAARVQTVVWFPRLLYAEGLAFWCLFLTVICPPSLARACMYTCFAS